MLPLLFILGMAVIGRAESDNFYLRSILIVEAEEGLPNKLELLSRQESIRLTTNGESFVELHIPEQSRNLTVTCQDAIVLVSRGGQSNEICMPRGISNKKHSVTVSGIREDDIIIASVPSNVNIPSRIIHNLANLPSEVYLSDKTTPLKELVYEATSDGSLLRTIVLRVEREVEHDDGDVLFL